MYNQNWHLVYGPKRTDQDFSPDVQVTEAMEMVFRMDGEEGDPGPEIVVYVFGQFADYSGQHDDESWPDIVVGTQVGYEIRAANGDVNDADYEYSQSDRSWPAGYARTPAVFEAVQAEAARIAARGDQGWDWNGKSAMNRTGGAT